MAAPEKKAKLHKSCRGANPDFRHQASLPAPPVADLERLLTTLLAPLAYQRWQRRVGLRERVLTLPALAAVVVGAVLRGLGSAQQAVRALALEGLLWEPAQRLSRQALTRRLAVFPAAQLAALLDDVITALRARPSSPAPPGFACCWLADVSTLEELRRRTEAMPARPAVTLGGRLLAVVEAFGHRPVAVWHTADSYQAEIHWTAALRALLPTGGLLVVDRGFFSFAWFESLTEAGQFFLTRWRQQAVFDEVQVLGQGPRYLDRLVRVGKQRRPPCQHPVRLVSVLWDTEWRHYVTNVLDPAQLSARQVVELYARRWRIEDAFLLTKRLLGLSYLWCSHANGVAIQLYATWLIYLVLNELVTEVAVQLSLPLERISYEMVFRSLPFVYRAQGQGRADEAASYLAAHADLLGLIKPVRPGQRAREQNHAALWTPAADASP